MDEMSLYGLTEAAKQLGMSVQHLRNLADRKAIPSLRDSAGRRLFLLPDIAELKAARARAKKNKVKLLLRNPLREEG